MQAPRAVSRNERRLEPSAPRQPRMAPARHTLAAPHRSTTTQRRTRNSEPAWMPGARTLPGVARLCWDLFSLPPMMPGSGRPCAPRACQWSGANDTSPAVSSDEKGLDCMPPRSHVPLSIGQNKTNKKSIRALLTNEAPHELILIFLTVCVKSNLQSRPRPKFPLLIAHYRWMT